MFRTSSFLCGSRHWSSSWVLVLADVQNVLKACQSSIMRLNALLQSFGQFLNARRFTWERIVGQLGHVLILTSWCFASMLLRSVRAVRSVVLMLRKTDETLEDSFEDSDFLSIEAKLESICLRLLIKLIQQEWNQSL